VEEFAHEPRGGFAKRRHDELVLALLGIGDAAGRGLMDDVQALAIPAGPAAASLECVYPAQRHTQQRPPEPRAQVRILPGHWSEE